MNPVYFTIMESLRALLARSNNCIYFIFITPWLICACKSRVCVIFRSDGGVHLIRIENVARNNKNYLLSKLLLAYFRIFGQELRMERKHCSRLVKPQLICSLWSIDNWNRVRRKEVDVVCCNWCQDYNFLFRASVGALEWKFCLQFWFFSIHFGE